VVIWFCCHVTYWYAWCSSFCCFNCINLEKKLLHFYISNGSHFMFLLFFFIWLRQRGAYCIIFVAEPCFIIIVNIDIVEFILLWTFILAVGILLTVTDLLISNEPLLDIVCEIFKLLTSWQFTSIVVIFVIAATAALFVYSKSI
jgi:hypothetical protein